MFYPQHSTVTPPLRASQISLTTPHGHLTPQHNSSRHHNTTIPASPDLSYRSTPHSLTPHQNNPCSHFRRLNSPPKSPTQHLILTTPAAPSSVNPEDTQHTAGERSKRPTCTTTPEEVRQCSSSTLLVRPTHLMPQTTTTFLLPSRYSHLHS